MLIATNFYEVMKCFYFAAAFTLNTRCSEPVYTETQYGRAKMTAVLLQIKLLLVKSILSSCKKNATVNSETCENNRQCSSQPDRREGKNLPDSILIYSMYALI